MNVVYETGHALNIAMSEILAKGFKAKRRPACIRATRPDGSLEFIPVKPSKGDTAIVYGILRGTGEILRECERQGEDYIYCDHSYFKGHRALWSGSRPEGYFRLVKNDRYYRDSGDKPRDRWERLGVKVRPWRKTGRHIVVVPVSKFVAAYNGFHANEWLTNTLKELKANTDRPVMIKPKDSETPIEAVLENAWALVTLESNAAVDALVGGIPVFAGVSAAVSQVAGVDLAYIEHPRMPDREQLFANLSYQQWNVEEIVSGEAAESMGAGGSAKRQECRVRDLPEHAPTLQRVG